jgi:hypothetical protein
VSADWAERQQIQRHNASPEYGEAYSHRGRVEAKLWELVHHGARRCRYIGDARGNVQFLLTVTVVNARRVLACVVGSRMANRHSLTLAPIHSDNRLGRRGEEQPRITESTFEASPLEYRPPVCHGTSASLS